MSDTPVTLAPAHLTAAAVVAARRTGLFLAFEGVEGAGKTTQLRAVAAALRGEGALVRETREPGGTTIGEQIRGVLLTIDNSVMTAQTETLLLMAARAQHCEEVIEPALRRGEWVLCDRFVGATLAYQGAGHGLPREELTSLQRFAVGTLRADVTVLLDVPVEIGMARRAAAGSVNRIDRNDRAFHQRVRENYLAQAEADPVSWIVLSGLREPSVLTGEILAALRQWRAPRREAESVRQ